MLDSDKIRVFLQQDLGLNVEAINKDSPLFSSGIIDSFALVSLMTMLEDEGGIRISPADVNVQNLDSIEKMLSFVESKR